MVRPLPGAAAIALLLALSHPDQAASADSDAVLEESYRAQLEAVDYLRDIYQTEEAILYPDNNIITVFVSQPYNAGVPFILYDASLVVDNKELSSHNYNGLELDKLMNDGVQIFTITHLDPGKHTLKAIQSGNLGLAGYSSSTSGSKRKDFSFIKGRSPYFLHLTITGSSREFQKEGWE